MYGAAVTTLVLGLLAAAGAYLTTRRKNPALTRDQRVALILGLVGALLVGVGVVLALLAYVDRT